MGRSLQNLVTLWLLVRVQSGHAQLIENWWPPMPLAPTFALSNFSRRYIPDAQIFPPDTRIVPIADKHDLKDRSFVALILGTKAVTQITTSFSLTWPALEQRERLFATGSFLDANSRCAQKSVHASRATKKQASTFHPEIQLLLLYPDSRWLRIASTKAVSSGATYLYNAT